MSDAVEDTRDGGRSSLLGAVFLPPMVPRPPGLGFGFGSWGGGEGDGVGVSSLLPFSGGMLPDRSSCWRRLASLILGGVS